MASSTESASTVLVDSVTSYATTVNIIFRLLLYRVFRSRMNSTTRRVPRASSTTVAALPAHHLSEWPRLKVEIALDLQPQGAANRFEFREHEVAPFLLHAADIAEEAEIMVLGLALGDIPSPVGIRCEKLCVHNRIGYLLLGVQRWQTGP